MDETKMSARERNRRRRANVRGGRQHRHEVGVTPEEEALLLQRSLARGVTIPRLLIEAALASDTGQTVTDRHDSLVELFRIRRYLAAVSNNVNQIARATNAGSPAGGELAHTLKAVRDTCDAIDAALNDVTVRS
ncbi:plasmid mobilization relaxosome protein MobC [Agreia pratensis]|uniref:plasmid mobilization relaxosome protein MobC n=1 Tax=Agreia pratensis TaxID=150121 RepID=UPI00188A34BF|nr:plasmid mobilization relaxosome protein MobC [Agreia pratensis]MBF4636201.1 plasmid mobilization relaxosome protein MobC [Agreia pratensis]